MDLTSILKSKIDSVAEGDYSAGLQAVFIHIETAKKHLSRGLDSGDETAFTDAIYRSNQAFEGSIKEAFRVLAEKDPVRMRPFDIESYLENNSIFKQRILKLFTNYRKEWRNPSTHDYILNFDEDEAFLAIVSVSAFACLLLDQIIEKLAYINSVKHTKENKAQLQKLLAKSESDLISRVTEIIVEFCRNQDSYLPSGLIREHQWLGAFSGFFTSAAPDIQLGIEVPLKLDERSTADLIASLGSEKVVIELKRQSYTTNNKYRAIDQVEFYMLLGEIEDAILLFIPTSQGPVEVSIVEASNVKGRIRIITPSRPNP